MTPSTSAAPSLYDRLGADAGIRAVVDGFYDRVEADPLLAPLFAHTAMARQRRQLAAFIAAAAGGPAYQGRSIRDAHADRGITQGHFDAVAAHLVAELESRDVDHDLIAEVVGAVGPLADEIVVVD